MAQVLLNDGEADFSLATDIPATRTARGGGYLGYLAPSTATRRR